MSPPPLLICKVLSPWCGGPGFQISSVREEPRFQAPTTPASMMRMQYDLSNHMHLPWIWKTGTWRFGRARLVGLGKKRIVERQMAVKGREKLYRTNWDKQTKTSPWWHEDWGTKKRPHSCAPVRVKRKGWGAPVLWGDHLEEEEVRLHIGFLLWYCGASW